MPSDDEGSEVESGREQFPKWVQSTLTHHCWCETRKQTLTSLLQHGELDKADGPSASYTAPWCRTHWTTQEVFPFLSGQRYASMYPHLYEPLWKLCSTYFHCDQHIVCLFFLLEFDVVIFWSWNVCISWFSLQLCLRHRNPSAGSLWILTARPQGTFWSRTAVIRQQILLSEDLKVGWKKKGTIWF